MKYFTMHFSIFGPQKMSLGQRLQLHNFQLTKFHPCKQASLQNAVNTFYQQQSAVIQYCKMLRVMCRL